MKNACPPVESFDHLLTLHPADPRRQHLDHCPRCRARLIAFRSFLEGGPLPAGADLDAARAHLTAAVRKEARLPFAAPPAPAPRAHPLGESWLQRVRARLSARPAGAPARPLLARPWAAALAFSGVAAVIVLLLVRPGAHRQGEIVLRGGPEVQEDLVLSPAETLADGSMLLRWRSISGAESYRVTFYAKNLEQIVQVSAGEANFLTIPAANLAALGPSGATVFWRVEAMAGGDPAVRSAPASLILP